ncbi:NDP-hexose 2,3-dehydratase family protein [Streptomyces sp. TRM49041]|uniref:NDP-hexose 2,3-dehydratase family protein n=1 Tax=Streptomyces sp. TRM49041 TaxID=2603216 RepID=UPI0011EC8514|nr:NDP-hexose 2,3-dehydratase family protein [Streptomyces sp. TRM49041]
MTAAALLRPRTAQDLAARLARSAAAVGHGHHLRTADVPGWLAERARAHRFAVRKVPLDRLDGWSFAPGTGDLVHHSGRFFSVRGLAATVDEGPFGSWRQPIIHQPEVGILGILAKEFDGVLHFLMQAKMEPGNPNLLQLSPTVQATRSNYQRVHEGAGVKYLEHFADPSRGQVLADSLQSEHGSWFYRKANRNILVETDAETPRHDDFCWLTLGQIGELLRLDHVVNMDARTVLSCFPMAVPEPGALHSDTELLSWFTAERARHDIDARLIPLARADGWQRDAEGGIGRPDGRYFRVTGVTVEAGNREVTGWSQPLIEPCGTGVAAFVFRRLGGVPHVLVNAKVEAGYLDTIELAPTVQATPGNWEHLPPEDRPPFLDAVLAAAPERIRYEAVHSEEGGRFLNASIRYLFVEADSQGAAEEATAVPPGYQWATVDQLNALTAHGHYVNVQARTLLACLNARAVRL